MGNYISTLLNRLWREKEIRVLILGLDNAGKTTFLYRLNLGEVVSTFPTIGFNMEVVKHKGIKFRVWDLGGQEDIRSYWKCYYANTDAIIYIIDSTDKERIDIAKEELNTIINEEQLKTAVLLVLANKQDKAEPMSESEITENFNLCELKSRTWTIFNISALTGKGVEDAMDWLADKIMK
ncbi:ADP-ribosylation factor-like protein 1 [Zophobas morio]|uniref:ADP-ribosylation factor-like protein 1 n=1 Tax=Zophobas morio TaxID=2755281 RepID=UPI003083C1B7